MPGANNSEVGSTANVPNVLQHDRSLIPTMGPTTRNAASSTATNSEDGGNKEKGEKTGNVVQYESRNKLPTPSATGTQFNTQCNGDFQAAV